MNSKKVMVSMMVILLMVLTHVFAGTGDTKADGKEIFKKTIAALGGAEKIKAINNVSYKMDLFRYLEDGSGTEMMQSKSIMQYPDKFWYWTKSPTYKFHAIMTVDGKDGWSKTIEEGKPVPPFKAMEEDVRKSQLAYILRDPFYISQNLDKYDIKLIGEKDLAGKETLELAITGPYQFHFYVDPKTFLPAGCMFKEVSNIDPEPVENIEIYSDFKAIDGIQIALKQNLMAKGKVWGIVTIKEVKFNVEVKEDFFKGK